MLFALLTATKYYPIRDGGLDKMRVFMPIRTLALTSIILSCAFTPMLAQQNTVTFDNKSGEPALVKLVGTTKAEVLVPSNERRSVKAAGGAYHIKVRYGAPGNYRFSKGDDFTIEEKPRTSTAISITLHKVVDGNYKSEPINEADFNDPLGKPSTEAKGKGKVLRLPNKTTPTQ